ncbi:MAG: hypothetical protein BWY64_02206 [bacterium ADurb.Bin363]|nr:MAG: hypothetical protein BWY64_02206 [bacterium ADurb.Bin363]
MSNPIITFEEIVRGIGKKQDNDDYNVIFRTKAAFYWIKKEKEDELRILADSAKSNSVLTIKCDALSREILEVKGI